MQLFEERAVLLGEYYCLRLVSCRVIPVVLRDQIVCSKTARPRPPLDLCMLISSVL